MNSFGRLAVAAAVVCAVGCVGGTPTTATKGGDASAAGADVDHWRPRPYTPGPGEARLVELIRHGGGKVECTGREPDVTVQIVLPGPLPSADTLARLSELKPPVELDLRNSRLVGRDLQGLAAGARVVHLNLQGAAVTDADLTALADVRGLYLLDLSDTVVTDAGVAALARIPGLRVLILDRTRVTDAGLKGLAAHKQLARLSLNGTAVTDAGLVHVAEHPRLNFLHLEGTKVSDAGLRALVPLEELMFVYLSVPPGTSERVEKVIDARKMVLRRVGGNQFRVANPEREEAEHKEMERIARENLGTHSPSQQHHSTTGHRRRHR